MTRYENCPLQYLQMVEKLITIIKHPKLNEMKYFIPCNQKQMLIKKENFLEITNFALMVQLYNRRIEMHLSIFNLEIDAFREL